MRMLTVDWADLEIAFRDATGAESWLDKESGEVMTIVKGFDDEAELREKLRRSPGRYLRLPVVGADFSRSVMQGFIARMSNGALKKKLQEVQDGPGGLARTMQLLRDDKPAFASFSRFEQGELMKQVEAFLVQHDIAPHNSAPAVELFEGVA